MRVSLVANVPHQTIFRRVEHVVKRNGQLDSAQIGRQMATRFRDRMNNEFAQLVREQTQLLTIELTQVGRIANGA